MFFCDMKFKQTLVLRSNTQSRGGWCSRSSPRHSHPGFAWCVALLLTRCQPSRSLYSTVDCDLPPCHYISCHYTNFRKVPSTLEVTFSWLSNPAYWNAFVVYCEYIYCICPLCFGVNGPRSSINNKGS